MNHSNHSNLQFLLRHNQKIFKKQRVSRTVHFSNNIKVIFINSTKAEIKQQWTSYEDRKRYHQTLTEDISTARSIFESKPPQLITSDELYQCVGIDKFLSQSVARDMKQRRKNLITAVLTEQCRQKRIGFFDEEDIRRVSEYCSEWARNRAHIIADDYYNIKE